MLALLATVCVWGGVGVGVYVGGGVYVYVWTVCVCCVCMRVCMCMCTEMEDAGTTGRTFFSPFFLLWLLNPELASQVTTNLKRSRSSGKSASPTSWPGFFLYGKKSAVESPLR